MRDAALFPPHELPPPIVQRMHEHFQLIQSHWRQLLVADTFDPSVVMPDSQLRIHPKGWAPIGAPAAYQAIDFP